jgi:hypothetical protein
MPVYDMELFDDDTCQQFSSRQLAQNPNKAKAAARREVEAERFDADGRPLEEGTPLRCLAITKLPDDEALAWIRSRPVDDMEESPVDPDDSAGETPTKKRATPVVGFRHIPRLLKAALARVERGTIQEDTEWVYQNLSVPWKDIPVDTVPSPGAITLLAEAKADRKWFLEKYHARLLPTKSQIDAGDWQEADDDQVAEMAARIREEMLVEDADE